jgi:hypothetical protein
VLFGAFAATPGVLSGELRDAAGVPRRGYEAGDDVLLSDLVRTSAPE